MDLHDNDKTPSREDTASASDLGCPYVAMGTKLLSNLSVLKCEPNSVTGTWKTANSVIASPEE